MSEDDNLLLKMLVEQGKQNTEITRAMAVSLAELSATVKHLEKRVDEVAPQVQRNIEKTARTDEHFLQNEDRQKDSRANRAQGIAFFSLGVAVLGWLANFFGWSGE